MLKCWINYISWQQLWYWFFSADLWWPSPYLRSHAHTASIMFTSRQAVTSTDLHFLLYKFSIPITFAQETTNQQVTGKTSTQAVSHTHPVTPPDNQAQVMTYTFSLQFFQINNVVLVFYHLTSLRPTADSESHPASQSNQASQFHPASMFTCRQSGTGTDLHFFLYIFFIPIIFSQETTIQQVLGKTTSLAPIHTHPDPPPDKQAQVLTNTFFLTLFFISIMLS